MYSSLTLCCGLIIASAIAYFVLTQIFKLLSGAIQKSGSFIKVIFIVLTLVGCFYIILDKERAYEIITKVPSSAQDNVYTPLNRKRSIEQRKEQIRKAEEEEETLYEKRIRILEIEND